MRLLQGCGKVAVRLWRHCNKKGENKRATRLRGDSNLHDIISYLTITLPYHLSQSAFLQNYAVVLVFIHVMVYYISHH